MEDKQIVELYWAREESAIDEAAVKYGSYCLYHFAKLAGCGRKRP